MVRSRIGVLALVLGACGGMPPRATAGDAERGHVELVTLEHGRALLIGKCGKCHTPPLPSEHVGSEWPTTLEVMSARAGLDQAQRRVIEEYLVTMARR